MSIYTIIGGTNGVGKSSLTGVLLSESNDLGTLIDVDKITADIGGDKIKGGKLANAKIEYCLENALSFTQETTLSGVKTLKTVKRAKASGYKIRLYYVALESAEESNLRIENRVRKGGHSIDPKDVNRRFGKRFEDAAKILPFCDEVIFYDNENGFRQVGEYRNGSVYFVGQNVPEWIKALDKYLKNK